MAGNAGAPDSAAPVSDECRANADCDAGSGQACVDGICRVACTSHYDCQGFGECVSGADADGVTGHFCDSSHPQKPGQFYTRCPGGDAECDGAAGFLCIGAGADDLEAYCTADCVADADCAQGFTCSPLVRSPCANACNVKGVPKDRQCIPASQIGADKPYHCGSRGPTRNICRPRTFCSSCETDADCLAQSDQICAKDKSGSKICTQLCDLKHPSCPWGNAGTCGLWDRDLGLATCAHKFGKCTGSGKGCEPCLQDADCGSKNACTSSEFTGEHWCVDFSVSCSCAGNADANGICDGGGCPLSPSQLEMQCIDTSPTGAAGVCVGADTVSAFGSSQQQSGCWPAK